MQKILNKLEMVYLRFRKIEVQGVAVIVASALSDVHVIQTVVIFEN